MSPVTPPTFFVANFPKYNVNINVNINEDSKDFKKIAESIINGDNRIIDSIPATRTVEAVVCSEKAFPIPSGLA